MKVLRADTGRDLRRAFVSGLEDRQHGNFSAMGAQQQRSWDLSERLGKLHLSLPFACFLLVSKLHRQLRLTITNSNPNGSAF